MATNDYCPTGYVCEATNCTAEHWNNSTNEWERITGVAIYKNQEGEIIAYIPGHGNLRTYKVKNKGGGYSLCVDINSKQYTIRGYNRF